MTRRSIAQKRREILWETCDRLIAEFQNIDLHRTADKTTLDDSDERHVRIFVLVVRALDGLCRLVERQGSQDEQQTMKSKIETLEEIQRRLARLAAPRPTEKVSRKSERR